MPSLVGSNAASGIYGENANPGGMQQAVPTGASSSTPAIGGSVNPLLPQPATGTATPNLTSSVNAAPMGATNPDGSSASGSPSGSDPTSTLAGSSVANLLGMGGQNGSWAPNQNDFIKAMRKAGFSAGDAGMLYNFLASGAGFNPAVANAMIAAMQPGIKQGEADIMEWMGSKGLSNSSTPAGYALSNYEGQVQLNEGQIFAGLYEQSVQNYMTVLMGGKGPAPQNTFNDILQFMATSSQAALNGAKAAAAG